MSAQPRPSFSDTDKLLQMSLLLRAIDEAHSELAMHKANHKARVETLTDELQKLRWEVLSGQERLPLEPIPPAAILPVMEKVVEMVNSGALDTPGVTCTAEVGPAAESSREEINRQKRQKKNAEPPPAPGGMQ
jgi:hypothetical protein